MRVITRNDETSAGRYLLAKSFVTCARRSCAGCCPLPRRARPKRSGRPSPPPRSTRRFSRVTYVRDLPVLSVAACSRCAPPLISVAIDDYLSSRVSLKRRVQTSGYVFPISFEFLRGFDRRRRHSLVALSHRAAERSILAYASRESFPAICLRSVRVGARARLSSSIWKGETAVRGAFPALGDHDRATREGGEGHPGALPFITCRIGRWYLRGR